MKKIIIISSLCLIFLNSCDKDVTISSVPEPVPQAFLYLESSPSGFTIYSDGRNTGRITPDSLPYIEAGIYNITLKKTNFKDTTISVEVLESEKKRISVDYYSNPSMYGSISFNSIPDGAGILLNDSSLNVTTPIIISGILPGFYNVTLKKENFRDVAISITVKSSEVTKFTSTLKDTSLWVDYQTFNSGIPNNILSSVASDSKGIKWIGTSSAGLVRYDEKEFTQFTTSNSSIPSNNIRFIGVDKLNRVWVCTDNGIGMFDGLSWTNYNTSNSKLLSNNVNVVNFSENGMVWIGTQANLVKYDNGSFSSYVYNSSEVSSFWINDIAFDSEGNLWLGTNTSGIIKFDGNDNFIVYQRPSNNLSSNSIISIAIDADNTKWFVNNPMTKDGVSYGGGMSSLAGDVFTAYTPWSGTLVSHSICIDKNGRKWICTKEGIYTSAEAGSFSIINKSNSSLTSNDVSQVIQDPNGIFWIATLGGGLVKYKGN